jgi:transcriptional regulator with XRE-family HTH domain
MMGDTGRIRDESKFRNEGDKIYAFKPQPHRFLSFFVEGKKIIVTNAFWKKQDKLPKGEKERALRCMESYKARIKEGKYMKKKNKRMSTYEREMQDPKFRAAFEPEYQEFALQELLLSMSQGDEKSVRNLAKQAGLHPNAIQNLRSGKTNDIKLTSFLKIARAYGFSLELVKGKVHIPVTSKTAKQEYA